MKHDFVPLCQNSNMKNLSNLSLTTIVNLFEGKKNIACKRENLY